MRDERGLYELIALLGFQCGLSWRVVLARGDALRAAFEGFDADIVAAYDFADVDRLMADVDIVRNRRKILAAIRNAQATVRLQKDGGLGQVVWSARPFGDLRPASIGRAPSRCPRIRRTRSATA